MHDTGPFDEVYIAARKRQSYLQDLLIKSMDNNITVAAITRTEGKSWLPSFFAAAKAKFSLHVIPNKEAIADVAHSLSRIHPWHYSNLCIIFAESSFIEKLTKHPEAWGKSIPEIEHILGNTVFGYCFTLDDGLVFYGSKTIQKIVSSISPA